MNKNAILIDFEVPDNWDFKSELENSSKKEWCIEKYISNRIHGSFLQKLIRYLIYFIFPFKIFLKRKEYENIIAWQQFYGIIFAFYCRLFRVKQAPNIVIMTFIYKAKKSIIGKIYYGFVNYALHSNHIKQIVIYSGNEKEYYSNIFNLPTDKFVVATLGVKDQFKDFEQVTSKGDYYLSAGRSNRDYNFLVDNWDYNKTLKIISDSFSCNDDRITLLDNCYGDSYLKQLAQCFAVVLILEDENVSSGQLVILRSMMFGKPVIITTNNTVFDYITDNINGLIINKDKQSLESALNKLENPLYYNYISKNARETFEKEFSLKILGRKIGELFIN